jgi:hypothetical protein
MMIARTEAFAHDLHSNARVIGRMALPASQSPFRLDYVHIALLPFQAHSISPEGLNHLNSSRTISSAKTTRPQVAPVVPGDERVG